MNIIFTLLTKLKSCLKGFFKRSLFKQFLAIFLSIFLIISTSYTAYANPLIWAVQVVRAVVTGAGAIGARAEATAIANGVRSVVTRSVTPTEMAKAIGAGAVGFGFSTGLGLAFEAIVGATIDLYDWYMDKESGELVYKLKSESGGGDAYDCTGAVFGLSFEGQSLSSVRQIAKSQVAKSYNQPVDGYTVTSQKDHDGVYKIVVSDSTDYFHWNELVTCKSFDSDPWKRMPLEELASKDIEMAKDPNDVHAKDIEDTMKWLADNNNLDPEFEANKETNNPSSSTPNTPTSAPDGTTGGDDKDDPAKTELPDFTCESMPFFNKVCDFIDWVKKEPDPEQASKPPKDATLSDVGLSDIDRFQYRIKFPAQCPTQNLTLTLFGRTYSHAIPYEPVCEVLQIIAPILVGLSCLGVAFYVVREVQ